METTIEILLEKLNGLEKKADKIWDKKHVLTVAMAIMELVK